jgi:hypothetical protein
MKLWKEKCQAEPSQIQRFRSKHGFSPWLKTTLIPIRLLLEVSRRHTLVILTKDREPWENENAKIRND